MEKWILLLFSCLYSFGSTAQMADAGAIGKALGNYEWNFNELSHPNKKKSKRAAKAFLGLFEHGGAVHANDLPGQNGQESLAVQQYANQVVAKFKGKDFSCRLDFGSIELALPKTESGKKLYPVTVTKTLEYASKKEEVSVTFYFIETGGRYLIQKLSNDKDGNLTTYSDEDRIEKKASELVRGKDVEEDLNGVPLKMVYVQGGSFQMGLPTGRIVSGPEYPAHTTTVADFWIGEVEITQEMYTKVMGGYSHSFYRDPNYYRDDFPAYFTWYKAVAFCNHLSQKNGLKPYYQVQKSPKDPSNINLGDKLKFLVTVDETADGYRLPTEAEWEYAALGGHLSQNHRFPGTSDEAALIRYGNFGDKGYIDAYQIDYRTESDVDGYPYFSPVKTFLPNELGLYDMGGNLSEWCFDWYEPYRKDGEPYVQTEWYGKYRVMRGGDYKSSKPRLRNKDRMNGKADSQDAGLRLVRSIPPNSPNKALPNHDIKNGEEKPQPAPSPKKNGLQRKGRWNKQ